MSTLREKPRGRSAAHVTADPGYRICTRRILETTDPEIRFNDAGRCNHGVRCEKQIANEKHVGEEDRKRLDETKHEFVRIMEMPIRRHADYPSNELFFHQMKMPKAIF